MLVVPILREIEDEAIALFILTDRFAEDKDLMIGQSNHGVVRQALHIS